MTQTQVSGSGIKNNVITNSHLHSSANIAGSKLANSGVTAGSYGSSSATLSLTINAQGLITAASTNAITQVGGSNGVDFNDNVKARFGTGNDLQIFHSGTYAQINDTAGSGLVINCNDFFVNARNSEQIIRGYANADVELFYDGVKKFETTLGGAAISNIQNNEGLNLNGVSNNTCIKFLSTGSSPAHGYRIAYHSTTNYIFNSPALTFDKIATNGIFSNHIAAVSDDGFHLLDNKKLHIGGVANSSSATGDLQIYHDGSNSYVSDQGTGVLNILGSQVFISSADNQENIAKFVTNGSVELYYDNDRKFRTTSSGGQIESATGDTYLVVRAEEDDASVDAVLRLSVQNASATSIIQFGDQDSASIGQLLYEHADNSMRFRTNGSEKWRITSAGHLENNSDTGILKLGASDDLQIYHDSNNSIIKNSTGFLLFKSNSGINLGDASDTDNYLKCIKDGAVELYHNGTKKFETTSSGISVTGSVNPSGNLAFTSNNCQIQTGSSGHTVAIQGGATNMGGRIELRGGNSDGDIRMFAQGATSTKVERLRINSSGVTIKADVLPEANNSRNLGSTSLRWANVYTNDLNLSNEGGVNDVDGTWGSYTIQEGEVSLFLINKRNGKKYKFNLTEVS